MNEIGGEMVRHYCPPLARIKVEKLQKDIPGNHSRDCHPWKWMKKEEKASISGVMKNLELAIDARTGNYFDWKCVEDEDEELEVESEEEEEVSQGNLAHISLNAMTLAAVPKFRTMRVTGHVGKTSVNIFIDYGSSHNFIHPDLVNKLGLRVQGFPHLVVEMADGNKITTNTLCAGFT